MKIKESRNKNRLVLLIILIGSLGLGFAFLRTNLTINGTGKIRGNTWNIYFDNINVTEGSVELSSGNTIPTIDPISKTEVTYAITLNSPGDFYEFTVDVVNAGSIDAMLDTITSLMNDNPIENLPNYMNYYVTYSDGIKLEKNQYLKSGETTTYKIRIEYKEDLANNDLPSTPTSLELKFKAVYIQADNNAYTVSHANNADNFLKTLTEETSTIEGCEGTGAFVKVTHDNGDEDYRYTGACPKNYVYFNCKDYTNPTSSTCELWRIIGLFNVKESETSETVERVKIIRNESLGNFSWNSSITSLLYGRGINQWGPSGTYEGAALMKELNGDYLNYKLSSNRNWIVNKNNEFLAGNFNKNYVIKKDSRELIDNTLWYNGATSEKLDVETTYTQERGESTCQTNNKCKTDKVTRTTTWTGLIGLPYPSDYGFATTNEACKENLNDKTNCIIDNWLHTGQHYWTISPYYNTAYDSINVHGSGEMDFHFTSNGEVGAGYGVRPAVYLKAGLKVRGSGTLEEPYIFTK